MSLNHPEPLTTRGDSPIPEDSKRCAKCALADFMATAARSECTMQICGKVAARGLGPHEREYVVKNFHRGIVDAPSGARSWRFGCVEKVVSAVGALDLGHGSRVPLVTVPSGISSATRPRIDPKRVTPPAKRVTGSRDTYSAFDASRARAKRRTRQNASHASRTGWLTPVVTRVTRIPVDRQLFPTEGTSLTDAHTHMRLRTMRKTRHTRHASHLAVSR